MGLDIGKCKYADAILEELGLEQCGKKTFRLQWGPEDPECWARKTFVNHKGQAWESAAAKIPMLLESKSEETVNEAQEIVAQAGKRIPFLNIWVRKNVDNEALGIVAQRFLE